MSAHDVFCGPLLFSFSMALGAAVVPRALPFLLHFSVGYPPVPHTKHFILRSIYCTCWRRKVSAVPSSLLMLILSTSGSDLLTRMQTMGMDPEKSSFSENLEKTY
eukprot:TRINITY_DN11292_c0_g1_i1.p1 TRINITY_DN11292_c0_g1~~TRINITY_DN11292_c0_g1_i1.p1  ORF type:complete len:105 (+),score=2.73 TRINITY_DN11292_c0_g1_i1:138-452(+)